MIEIRVTDEERDKILSQIYQNQQRTQINWEQCNFGYLIEDENGEYNTEHPYAKMFLRDVERLQRENVVTQRLIMATKANIDIKLSAEQEEEILTYVTEGDYETIKGMIFRKEHSINFKILRVIYQASNVLEKRDITIVEPEMREALLLCEKTRPRATASPDYTDLIKSGRIPYSRLRSYQKEHLEFFKLYQCGALSEDEFLKQMGSKEANPDILNIVEKYDQNKRKILSNTVNDIIESYKKLQKIGEKVPENEAEQIRSIVTRIQSLGDISNVSIEILEEIVDEYNKIANQVWKKYLDGKNNFLIHATTIPIEGQYQDLIISTSLVSKNYTRTYQGRVYGYKIKPKNIVCASARDLQISNTQRDKYAAIGEFNNSILVQLPQIVRHEGMQNNQMSEVALDDFEIESVVGMIAHIDTLKKYSEAQGNIPIEILTEKGLISLEEYLTEMQERQEQPNQEAEKKQEEERQEQPKLKVEKLRKELEAIVSGVDIEKEIQEFIKIINYYKDMAQKLGVKTYNTQSLDGDLRTRLQNILKVMNAEIEGNNLDTQYKNLDGIRTNYNAARDEVNQLNSLSKEYEEQSLQDLKIQLNQKIQEVIYRIESKGLRAERQTLLFQEDNLLNRLLGRTALKNAKVRNINARLTRAQNKKNTAYTTKSVTQMLEDMYECAYNFNNEERTQEMIGIEQAIRSAFNDIDIPSTQDLREKIYRKQRTGLPSVTKKNIFSWHNYRREARQLNQETDSIDRQNKETISERDLKATGKPETKLTSIYVRFNEILSRIEELVSIEKEEKDIQQTNQKEVEEN